VVLKNSHVVYGVVRLIIKNRGRFNVLTFGLAQAERVRTLKRPLFLIVSITTPHATWLFISLAIYY